MKNTFKLSFLLLSIIAVFSLVGCAVQLGGMAIELQGATAVKTGQTVPFKAVVGEDVKVAEATAYLYGPEGETVEMKKFDDPSNLEWKIQFKVTGKYKVEYFIKSANDYGTASANVNVTYGGASIDWKLANNPANALSIEADKITKVFAPTEYFLDDLASLEGVNSIGVKLLHMESNTVLFFKKAIKNGTFKYTATKEFVGPVKMIVFVHMNDGNTVRLEDMINILDPDNPVNIMLKVSNNDVNHQDTIYVTGVATYEDNPVTKLKLVRRCWYGKEEGVYPLAQPEFNPVTEKDKFYTKYKVEWPVHEMVYDAFTAEGKIDPESPLKFNPDDGSFEFVDPMPYFNEKGEVEKTGFKWDYAKIDREAWKYILRKKNVDFKKVFGVEYQIITEGNPEKGEVKSLNTLGIPYLSTTPMAQFCMWVKEVAMNRLWHMQAPRFCWGSTRTYLTMAQSSNGNYGGKVAYSIQGTAGNGYIKDYSDWPGLSISTTANINVKPELATNKRQNHDVHLMINTDLWGNIKFDINNLGVRDYILQWGAWVDDANGDNAYGTLDITRPGSKKETVDGKGIKAMMPWYKGWGVHGGWSYEKWDAGPGDKKGAWSDGATWSKIHYKYAPTPTRDDRKNGSWGDILGVDDMWSIKYEVE